MIAETSASGNTIGGTAAGAGNTIAFNTPAGVAVGYRTTDTSVNNAILSNVDLLQRAAWGST